MDYKRRFERSHSRLNNYENDGVYTLVTRRSQPLQQAVFTLRIPLLVKDQDSLPNKIHNKIKRRVGQKLLRDRKAIK